MNLVDQWLWDIGNVPPLVVELVLKDGQSFYAQSVLQRDDDSRTGVIRIWDLRALSSQDIEDLKTALSSSTSRKEREDAVALFPKLDYANLHLHFDDVAYCIEWHDRFWPTEERRSAGFRDEKSTG
jgi:hypothetical protein